MNEHLIHAGFLRRLGALVIDAGVILVLASAVFWIWASRVLGGIPQTPTEFAWLLDAGQAVAPGFFIVTGIAYTVACWTPFLGHRTVGMRQLSIVVARQTP
jgi:hypothetical protein